ncbi:murein hydrolase activator EnvC family protein [Pedobacter psychroterrae]|uniref:Peptidase M23 n=1 Tax=Pedobacter psychroterrae TaxID=2530453 RepID=A0A4R0NHV3_9SPHI|nr:peptidoglycan DD-metalloendopeptidase family protein [Pedobacter psychroterrae]TCD00056.1 peptidase M23 [Pedobacter psychroterrae]
MKLKRLLFILLLIIATPNLFAQSSSELKRKKQALQREIELLQKNANKAATNKKLTLNQINNLNAQIGLMQNKIEVINSEIKGLDNRIHENTNSVKNLKGQLGSLRKEYANMIRFAQRNRNSYERMMFIFASKDFYQAYMRMKHIQQVGAYRKKQAGYIEVKEKNLKYEIVILDKNLKEKSHLVQEQLSEKDKLGQSKNKQSQALTKFSKQEQQLKQDIVLRKKKQASLDRDISTAIAREIAAARKKVEEEERKAAAKAKAANKPKPVVAKAKTSAEYLTASPKAAKLSSDFERNRGSLPYPVNGTITERFGKHMEGQATYVNNGVNIETSEGASVKAVFNGEVRSVACPGGTCYILIKHGQYFTVYQNLKSVSVSVGDNVTTNQAIGVVASTYGQNMLQFQIIRSKDFLNPEGWIRK